MTGPEDLKVLYEKAHNLREALANLEAEISRIEDDQWRKHMAERDRIIKSGDSLPSPLKGR